MSITANPAEATRRRPVVSGENEKSNVDSVNDGTISPLADKTAVIGSPGNAGKIAGGRNKDLSHSIRGKKALQKSKDMIQKTLQPNSTAYPRRTRRMAPLKSERPLWRTVFSVFMKNFLLFLALAGLVQMVRKLVINIGSDGSVNLAGFSDMEGRIADVESFLKMTTTMLQLQLEAVDKKVDGEFSNLRGEMNKKFEEKSEEMASRLKLLDEKNEILEKALGHLTSKDLLSKEDLAKFYEEFKRSKNGDLGGNDLSLDEIKALARQIVEKEIEKHAADGLGMIDYALATAGAMVVKHSEPYVVGKGGDWFSMTNWKGDSNDAEKMLKPSFGEPGQCFPLKGNSGYVQIKLRTAIIPEAITLEHVAKTPDIKLQSSDQLKWRVLDIAEVEEIYLPLLMPRLDEKRRLKEKEKMKFQELVSRFEASIRENREMKVAISEMKMENNQEMDRVFNEKFAMEKQNLELVHCRMDQICHL